VAVLIADAQQRPIILVGWSVLGLVLVTYTCCKGGIETLLTRHHLGLTPYLEQELHLTAKLVAAYIKKRWQVNYSGRGVVALLHRLGFCYKKPKLISGKADAQAQEYFLEEYKKLKENKGKVD